jgi:hypothetical protein
MKEVQEYTYYIWRFAIYFKVQTGKAQPCRQDWGWIAVGAHGTRLEVLLEGKNPAKRNYVCDCFCIVA